MGWVLRLCGENVYHYIYAWGNDRHPIFKSADHYKKYLTLLEKYALFFDVDVIAYALMATHVHLFVYDRSNKLSHFMMKLHGDYARYYNRINERVGHVFGERFNNKIVAADIYGKWLSRYIHRQAVEAGLVTDPVDWSKRDLFLVGGDDLIKYICDKLKLEVCILKNPQGAKERSLRHLAIVTLYREYGYKPYQLARVFGLSRSTVARTIKKKTVSEDDKV